MSDENRAALDSSVDEAIQHYLANYGKLLEKWETILTEKDVEKVAFPPEEIAKFEDKAATGTREQWIKDMEAQGIPGQELYDLVQATLKDMRGSN